MREEPARRARREVARLTHNGLDWVAMATQVSSALKKAVPFERHCWHTIDPATLVFTGTIAENLGEEPRLAYHEYAIPDVNKWAFLATSARHVGVLSETTNGNPESSPRFRSIHQPRGIGDELRASFVSDGACWGATGIYRDRGEPAFTEDEATFIGSVARQIADGFRRAALLSALDIDGPVDGPGLVLLDATGELAAITPAAERWLEEFIVDHAITAGLPHVVRAVAQLARTSGDGDGTRSARVRVATRSGRWLVLHGSLLAGDDRVAVIIEPAAPHEIAPLIVQAYGLSERERQITMLCLHGLSTSEIASKLFISPLTVQDHLKAVFTKVGVRSRRELVARIFMDHVWPTGRPLDLDGDWLGVDFDVSTRAG